MGHLNYRIESMRSRRSRFAARAAAPGFNPGVALGLLAFLVLLILSVAARADQIRTHPSHFGTSATARELGPPVDPTRPQRIITHHEVDGIMARRSEMPFWEVGTLDKNLSMLCSTGRFNQVDTNRVTVGFSGPVGQGVLGMAKGDGWNLYDPTRVAKKDSYYYFHRDRTGQCSVFVWTENDRRSRKGAVMEPPGYRRETVNNAYKRGDER